MEETKRGNTKILDAFSKEKSIDATRVSNSVWLSICFHRLPLGRNETKRQRIDSFRLTEPSPHKIRARRSFPKPVPSRKSSDRRAVELMDLFSFFKPHTHSL